MVSKQPVIYVRRYVKFESGIQNAFEKEETIGCKHSNNIGANYEFVFICDLPILFLQLLNEL